MVPVYVGVRFRPQFGGLEHGSWWCTTQCGSAVSRANQWCVAVVVVAFPIQHSCRNRWWCIRYYDTTLACRKGRGFQAPIERSEDHLASLLSATVIASCDCSLENWYNRGATCQFVLHHAFLGLSFRTPRYCAIYATGWSSSRMSKASSMIFKIARCCAWRLIPLDSNFCCDEPKVYDWERDDFKVSTCVSSSSLPIKDKNLLVFIRVWTLGNLLAEVE